MAPPPGPYSGTSTLALVARVSACTLGVVYGTVKHKILKIKQEWGFDNTFDISISIPKAKAKSHAKAQAKANH